MKETSVYNGNVVIDEKDEDITFSIPIEIAARLLFSLMDTYKEGIGIELLKDIIKKQLEVKKRGFTDKMIDQSFQRLVENGFISVSEINVNIEADQSTGTYKATGNTCKITDKYKDYNLLDFINIFEKWNADTDDFINDMLKITPLTYLFLPPLFDVI